MSRAETMRSGTEPGKRDDRASNPGEDRGYDVQRAPRLPIPRWLRVACALIAVGLTATLITARVLQPSPDGIGTHQQLGLPPCTSIVLWDVPCPACGMTTSWSYLVRGQVFEAFHANAGGALLSIIALVCIPATCYFSFAGQASKRERFSLYLAAALLIAIIVAIAQWYTRTL